MLSWAYWIRWVQLHILTYSEMELCIFKYPSQPVKSIHMPRIGLEGHGVNSNSQLLCFRRNPKCLPALGTAESLTQVRPEVALVPPPFLLPPPACWAALGVMPTLWEPLGSLLHGLIPYSPQHIQAQEAAINTFSNRHFMWRCLKCFQVWVFLFFLQMSFIKTSFVFMKNCKAQHLPVFTQLWHPDGPRTSTVVWLWWSKDGSNVLWKKVITIIEAAEKLVHSGVSLLLPALPLGIVACFSLLGLCFLGIDRELWINYIIPWNLQQGHWFLWVRSPMLLSLGWRLHMLGHLYFSQSPTQLGQGQCLAHRWLRWVCWWCCWQSPALVTKPAKDLGGLQTGL